MTDEQIIGVVKDRIIQVSKQIYALDEERVYPGQTMDKRILRAKHEAYADVLVILCDNYDEKREKKRADNRFVKLVRANGGF